MGKMHLFVAIVVCLTCAGVGRGQVTGENQPSEAAALPAAEGSPDVLSYALGFNIGSNMRENEINVELQGLLAGIEDGLKGANPRWTKAELSAALQLFQEQMQQKAMAKVTKMAEANKLAGDAFLAKNGSRESVQTTASGLQYLVLTAGNGPSPTASDTVRCHYRGTLMDGTEFDSSYGGEPAEFRVGGVIPGWTEALQKMRVGDKWQLFVPADLAYGVEPPGPPIEPNSLLIFEVELLGIVGQ